jgi:hypothetical protein
VNGERKSIAISVISDAMREAVERSFCKHVHKLPPKGPHDNEPFVYLVGSGGGW